MSRWLAFLVLFAFGHSLADDAVGPSASIMIGNSYFDDDVEDTTHWQVGVGYHFEGPWAVEAIFGEASGASVEGTASELDLSRWQVDLLFEPETDRPLQPYLGIGAGEGTYEFTGGGDVDRRLYSVIVGMKIPFNNTTSFRGDVRLFDSDENQDLNSAISFGIHHVFGTVRRSPAPVVRRDSDGDGVLDTQDSCPETSPGTQVDSRGCPRDDDGDGVVNALDRCPGTAAGVRVDQRGCAIPGDADGDGVVDDRDRCPGTTRGVDVDENGCERDDDGDGVTNVRDQCPDTQAGAAVDDTGCYLTLTETVTVELNVQFGNNSDEALPEHRSAVRRVYEFMRQYPETRVTIEGHTDSRGSAEYNRDLSQRRADTIADLLVREFGVDASRVSAVGVGEERPIATNETAEGRQQNRRVVGVVEALAERRVSN
ncbi:MAG: OmpA family protein [Pseudomonadota bacterium]